MTTKIQDVYRVLFIHRIVDGDTWWLRIDQRFRDWKLIECRLAGYDTPESQSSATRKISDFERSQAAHARRVVEEFLTSALTTPGQSLLVRTDPDPEKYGRWLSDLWLESDGDQWPERHLGAELHSQGLASVYDPSKPAGQRGHRWYEEFDTTLGK